VDEALRASEVRRAEALVAPEWSGLSLERRPPQPDPEEIGAVTGFGLAGPDERVRANVYLFERWGQGTEVGTALQEMIDGDGYRAVAATNGRLLLLAVAGEHDAAGLAELNQLVGAFHGYE
jgi:hypothetical protein